VQYATIHRAKNHTQIRVSQCANENFWTSNVRKDASMDRTSQLVEIYEKSGLKDVLVSNGHYFDPRSNFSKLKFTSRNPYRVSSIELWDRKEETSFRIHYRPAAPAWLPEALNRWPNVRSFNSFGTDFVGDPLVPAMALAELLRTRAPNYPAAPRPRRSPVEIAQDQQQHGSGRDRRDRTSRASQRLNSPHK
jgi:hypothetical protein